MWQTWVQSRAQVMSLHLCHFRCCSFAWKTGKPKRFVFSFPSPFCVLHMNSSWQIVKTGTSSRSRGRIGRTKWRRKCIFRGFPEISRSFIYTYSHSKEKHGNVECQWYKLRPRLNSGLLHFPSVTNARNFDTSDLLPWTRSKQGVSNRWNRWSENQSNNRWQSMPC